MQGWVILLLYYEAIENKCNSNWVVFIHGLGGSIHTWKKQIEDFSKNYNLLLVDLHGHGKSQEINFSKPNDYSEICSGIKEILDSKGILKANFVGMSLGTFILINYAIKYPQTVYSLILGGGVIALEKSRLLLIDFVQIIKNILPCNILYRLFSYILMPRERHKKSREIFNREALKLKRKEFINWVKSLKQMRYGEKYIAAINKFKEIPILYVMGSEDYMFLQGTKNAVQKMASATLEIIENCGHVCTIEKYKEFNTKALNFLQSKSI